MNEIQKKYPKRILSKTSVTFISQVIVILSQDFENT